MDFLQDIVQTTREAVDWRRSHVPVEDLRRCLTGASPPRDFIAALLASSSPALIAEVKRASPSAGTFLHTFDPVSLALIYQGNGARAISVLTEEEHFHGSLDVLSAVREAVALPVLLKDFVIDEYQIFEARAVGADAVLLIAELLDDKALERFLSLVRSLGMQALVEAFHEQDLRRVVRSSARVVGINNRDLTSFRTSLQTTLERAPIVPSDRILVSESGIRSAADVRRVASAGVRAVLVGEALVAAPDVASKVRELASV